MTSSLALALLLAAQDIQFSSSLDGVLLHGTLTLTPGPVKGVVLMIGGSGKTDRDESVPPR